MIKYSIAIERRLSVFLYLFRIGSFHYKRKLDALHDYETFIKAELEM